MMTSRNPATGEVLGQFEEHTDPEIEARLQRAIEAWRSFRGIPLARRGRWLAATAETLEAQKESLGRLMTLEMGKPIQAAVQEVEKCALACRYYAENAAGMLETEHCLLGSARAEVRYQSLGAVLAIMPWNFPFWQVFRFAAPNLMAGNVGLLKHASNVPQCALAIERVLAEAGFPAGSFQTFLVGSRRVAALIADRRVAAVTLTGSVEAGRLVATEAGRHLKKTVLELGGSDPFVVMPSADLEQAAAVAARARVINNGQSCIAAKRFILHQNIAAEFTDRFLKVMAGLKVGDPLDPSTDVGPLATSEVLDGLEHQVNESVRLGAQLLFGGKRLPGPGWFYPPTVLARIPEASPAAQEELFGPVASLFVAKDLAEALRIANGTHFGLGACLWSNDASEHDAFIEGIESGLAFINGMVASDPRVPFGGLKDSGYGRELGLPGLREFVNIKTVVQAAPTRRTE